MRLALALVLALGPFMALCASADASTVHHPRPRHHVSVGHAYGMMPGSVVRPSQGFDPRFPPVIQDQTPSYDDPSKWGGP